MVPGRQSKFHAPSPPSAAHKFLVLGRYTLAKVVVCNTQLTIGCTCTVGKQCSRRLDMFYSKCHLNNITLGISLVTIQN